MEGRGETPKPEGKRDPFINKRNRDYYAGGLVILLGCGAIVQGSTYGIGTLRSMDSGYFPVALGVVLALLGAGIVATAQRNIPEGEEKFPPPEWRGWACIALGVVAFVVLGRYGGLLPATFAIVFISALGDRNNTLKSALLLSLALVVVGAVVFRWALRVQFPLFQWG